MSICAIQTTVLWTIDNMLVDNTHIINVNQNQEYVNPILLYKNKHVVI